MGYNGCGGGGVGWGTGGGGSVGVEGEWRAGPDREQSVIAAADCRVVEGCGWGAKIKAGPGWGW